MSALHATSLDQEVAQVAPLSSFHLFPLLPAELRLKIWSLLLPGPRDIEIKCLKGVTPLGKRFPKSFTSTTPPPVLLYISHESRAEAAAALYRPLFQTADSDQYIWTSLDLDTIVMVDSDLRHVGSVELEGIQRLRLNVTDCMYFGHYNMSLISKMAALRHLTVVMDEEVIRREDQRARWHPYECILDFDDEKKDNPGWECPRLTILGSISGKVLGSLEGGALVPGWQPGDPIPGEGDITTNA